MGKYLQLSEIYGLLLDHPIATAEGIFRALKHINTPFHWCGLSSDQHAAVYWHVRGKSARQTGEIMGKSKHTIRKHLVLAVRKINKAEDWEIKIRDLADVLLKLIKEELEHGEEKGN